MASAVAFALPTMACAVASALARAMMALAVASAGLTPPSSEGALAFPHPAASSRQIHKQSQVLQRKG
ncbi:hypothetical protein [Thermobaculum terrenum]|uniref:hypothetical protein n=1 Tax=Thermobaculum terrenum TaxID=166501 RepID=UPI00019BF60E